jgi:DNA-binding protein HU-beta
MAKMTKSAIMQVLAEKNALPKKQVVAFMDSLVELAYKEVKANGEFVVPGVGKLVKLHRKAREGRNPATGQTIQIPAKTVVKFRVSKIAKDAIL